MKTLLLLSVLALPVLAQQSSGYQAMVQEAKSRIKEIKTDELKQLQESKQPFVLIDVREESEWNAGHALGALHLSRGVLERDIEKRVADKGAKVVLYCGSGGRSALAADSLQKLGYTNVSSLAGGIRDYTQAGLPVEKAEKNEKK
jgi:rhodanese-related sulfurtransferase